MSAQRPRLSRAALSALLVIGTSLIPSACLGQGDFELLPIRYSKTKPSDRVQNFGAALAAGTKKLEWDESHGWLPSLLDQLGVPPTSQTLVFSKTSLQFRKISPSRPRALYFSADVYIGWVPGGVFIEIAAVDPNLGAVFYTLDQKHSEAPRIVRDRDECLTCHATQRTRDVPGFLVRSVYVDEDGQPDLRLGTVTTDHRTPLVDRFGGWYVTGRHGTMRHRGNISRVEGKLPPIDSDMGANRIALPQRVRADDYLRPSSDIVALMLLEHQTQWHNLVTRAGYAARQVAHQQEEMNRLLGRPPEYRSEGSLRRIRRAAEGLVEYLLFCDEFALSSPVQGDAAFGADFQASGVRDSKGRSLRDLDLETRLLRYPCSYLVYSESFRALPKVILDHVQRRVLEVLERRGALREKPSVSGTDETEDRFAHLSTLDRRHIREILEETHPLWKRPSAPR